MSRVQELPDEFDASSVNLEDVLPNVSSQPVPAAAGAPPSSSSKPAAGISEAMLAQSIPFPPKDTAQDAHSDPANPTAAMPPAMASTRAYTADEVIGLLNRSPLFMTDLDPDEENPELEALKALAWEGTRAEVAANFREQGNECAREKQWGEARTYYGQALAALRQEQRRPEGQGGRLDGGEGEAEVDWVGAESSAEAVDLEDEARRERETEEACYVNRALCNLEMKNYGACNRDAAAALRLNPRNVKAYYRSGLACLALDKIDAAVDCCNRAVAVEPGNAAVKKLIAKVNERREVLVKQQKARVERYQRQQKEAATLKKALNDRGIAVIKTDKTPTDLEDAKVQLADPLDETSVLSFPTLFLYPTHSQSDFIKVFQETETVKDHLSYIFPCPWDTDGEFAVDSVECYMDTAAGGMIKLGKKIVLGTVLAGGNVELMDGMCRIYVVPKSKAKEWIAEVKRRKAG